MSFAPYRRAHRFRLPRFGHDDRRGHDEGGGGDDDDDDEDEVARHVEVVVDPDEPNARGLERALRNAGPLSGTFGGGGGGGGGGRGSVVQDASYVSRAVHAAARWAMPGGADYDDDDDEHDGDDFMQQEERDAIVPTTSTGISPASLPRASAAATGIRVLASGGGGGVSDDDDEDDPGEGAGTLHPHGPKQWSLFGYVQRFRLENIATWRSVLEATALPDVQKLAKKCCKAISAQIARWCEESASERTGFGLPPIEVMRHMNICAEVAEMLQEECDAGRDAIRDAKIRPRLHALLHCMWMRYLETTSDVLLTMESTAETAPFPDIDPASRSARRPRKVDTRDDAAFVTIAVLARCVHRVLDVGGGAPWARALFDPPDVRLPPVTEQQGGAEQDDASTKATWLPASLRAVPLEQWAFVDVEAACWHWARNWRQLRWSRGAGRIIERVFLQFANLLVGQEDDDAAGEDREEDEGDDDLQTSEGVARIRALMHSPLGLAHAMHRIRSNDNDDDDAAEPLDASLRIRFLGNLWRSYMGFRAPRDLLALVQTGILAFCTSLPCVERALVTQHTVLGATGNASIPGIVARTFSTEEFHTVCGCARVSTALARCALGLEPSLERDLPPLFQSLAREERTVDASLRSALDPDDVRQDVIYHHIRIWLGLNRRIDPTAPAAAAAGQGGVGMPLWHENDFFVSALSESADAKSWLGHACPRIEARILSLLAAADNKRDAGCVIVWRALGEYWIFAQGKATRTADVVHAMHRWKKMTTGTHTRECRRCNDMHAVLTGLFGVPLPAGVAHAKQ